MAVENLDGQVRLICDRTGRAFDWYKASEFQTMIDDAKKARWQIFQKSGEWRHQSPAI